MPPFAADAGRTGERLRDRVSVAFGEHGVVVEEHDDIGRREALQAANRDEVRRARTIALPRFRA